MLSASVAMVQEKDKFLADRHKDRGVACAVCHGDENPPKPAAAGKCMTCHKSLEAVAERTKDYDKNPHKNHLTESMEVSCVQCHNGHKADEPACLRCHSGMTFARRPAESK
jgi:fumarate reductase flavoprotein subunit